jgi:hypothetical protein
MFDLEKSIAGWRHQMLTAGIKTPVPLDELENHLREEIERQMKSGANEQKAFTIAVQQIGQPLILDSEFKKDERNIMKRIAIMALGIFGVLFGPALILPALAKHQNLGMWNFDIIWPIVIGAAITLAGVGMAIFGFKKRKA